MVLLVRKPLIDAGRHALWGEHMDQGGEFGEGFVEGMAVLQRYPLKKIGMEVRHPSFSSALDMTKYRGEEEIFPSGREN